MPKISVIIPVYNGEKTIQKTIESVLKQTFQDLELIVINDGSQDATLEVLSSIQDPRLRILSYSNAGLASSRNRGITEATGEYISFLDADDLWTPDKLEAQLQALQEHPEAAVAYSWTDCIDELGQFSRRGSHISAIGYVYSELCLIDFLENGSNPLIKHQVFTKVGNFDESLPCAEDWDMWLRLAIDYPFVVVPKPQVLYRVSSESMSSDVWKMEQGCCQVIEQAFSRVPLSVQYLKTYSLANLYKYLIFRALQGKSNKEKAITAIRFFFQMIKYDLAMLKAGVCLKIIFKIFVILLFPIEKAMMILENYSKFSNTSTLLSYLTVKPPHLSED